MGYVTPLGVVVGMPQEAALLQRCWGPGQALIFCSGTHPERIPAGVADMLSRGAGRLLSFGFCGALDDTLASGDIVVADAIITANGERFAVDAAMEKELRLAIAGAGASLRCGPILGVNKIVASAQRKRQLAAASGAIACDMESHAMALAASSRPIGAVRVVFDVASRSVPAAVLGAMGNDGRLRLHVLLKGLLQRPADIGALLALARDDRRARPALRRAAAALGRLTRLV